MWPRNDSEFNRGVENFRIRKLHAKRFAGRSMRSNRNLAVRAVLWLREKKIDGKPSSSHDFRCSSGSGKHANWPGGQFSRPDGIPLRLRKRNCSMHEWKATDSSQSYWLRSAQTNHDRKYIIKPVIPHSTGVLRTGSSLWDFSRTQIFIAASY